jgi:phenylacetate-CoA ligase
MKKAFSKKNIWEKKPSFVSSILKRGLGIFSPAFLLGKNFRSNCQSINQMQWWPAEKTRQYQLLKLREITKLAYENTKFYHDLFDSVGFDPEKLNSLDDLKKLPVIDKQIVIQNIKEMCTRPVTDKDIDFISTGGTSGMPLNFYINATRSSIEYAYLTTSWNRIGYKTGIPLAVLRSRIVQKDKKGLYHEYDPILRHHYYSVFHLSDDNIARYLKHISTIGMCFLHVYPSSVQALAKFILRSGQQTPQNIQGIIAESEIVYPEQQQMIEKVFGCRLFSCYGQSEKLVLACGCEQSGDYHVWPAYGYYELIDKNGNQVQTPGQIGEIVGTGFINTIMPFIRFRTGDLAAYVGDHCEKCRREHIIIRDIRGHRIQEMLVAADGFEISWTSLNMHDDTFINVRQFQFMQETPGQAILRVVPAEGFSKKDIAKIQNRLGEKLDNSISIKIVPVEEIALSSRGKAIYVDQRIPGKMTE